MEAFHTSFKIRKSFKFLLIQKIYLDIVLKIIFLRKFTVLDLL